MKTKVKVPAKINLSLDITGKNGSYHDIKSLVTSVSVFDTVTVKKRKDNCVKIKEKGIKTNVPEEKNNAYKAALLFKERYKTSGVTVIIKKNIPLSSGLGGSSADIVGVLKAMNSLFAIDVDLKPLCDELGSDTGYMLSGGLAFLSGRGEKVEYIPFIKPLYLLFITENREISAGECYKKYDEEKFSFSSVTDTAKEKLLKGDVSGFLLSLKNDLYFAAVKILPNLEENIEELKKSGADKALMTGSGSAVYGIFTDKKKRDKAYKKLKIKYGKRLIKAKTL